LKWSRLNPYVRAIINRTVVEIQCPHCECDIELESGVSGTFDCPHCDEEFSWSGASKWSLNSILKWINIIGAALFVLGLIVFLIMLITFSIEPPTGYGGLILIFPIGMMLAGVTVSYLSLLTWILGKKIRKEPVRQSLFYLAIAPLLLFLLIIFPFSIALG